jgi:hypothetical protein
VAKAHASVLAALMLVASFENGWAVDRKKAPPASAPGTTMINGQVFATSPVENEGAPSAALQRSDIQFKRVFLFPAVDDIQGVMAPLLDERLEQLFRANSRFALVRDAQVIRALAPTDSAYAKAATSKEVHREAIRVSGADSSALVRTRNVGNSSELVLEIRDRGGDLLFSEQGTIPGFSSMEVRRNQIDRMFRAVVDRIPYDGTVTGRTGPNLTLDLSADRVQPGDQVDIVRLVSVQRHPLLRTVIGSDYVRLGRARITGSDRVLSFAELEEMLPGESIQAGARVLVIGGRSGERFSAEPARRASENRPRAPSPKDDSDERLSGDFEKPKARYGEVSGSIQYGSLAHSQTGQGATQEYTGSGIGASLQGELWVTRNWIATLGYSMINARLGGTSAVLGDGSMKKIELAGGYRFFPEGSEDLSITGSLGYISGSFTVPGNGLAGVGSKKYTGISLKLDGDMAFHRNHRIVGGFYFAPFPSFTDLAAPKLGAEDGGNMVGFRIAWRYRWFDLLWAQLGIEFDSHNGSYTNNGTVANKRLAIGPGLSYSF